MQYMACNDVLPPVGHPVGVAGLAGRGVRGGGQVSTVLGAAIPEERADSAWVEGVAIWVAIAVVVTVGQEGGGRGVAGLGGWVGGMAVVQVPEAAGAGAWRGQESMRAPVSACVTRPLHVCCSWLWLWCSPPPPPRPNLPAA